jgi:hypothetical protein
MDDAGDQVRARGRWVAAVLVEHTHGAVSHQGGLPYPADGCHLGVQVERDALVSGVQPVLHGRIALPGPGGEEHGARAMAPDLLVQQPGVLQHALEIADGAQALFLQHDVVPLALPDGRLGFS